MDYLLNARPSPTDNRDLHIESLLSTKILTTNFVDHRNDLLSVRNQGTQGSCAAQTAACMKEWQERQDVNFQDYMSPQFIYNNRENQESEGMYPRDVMKILINKGSCREVEYPYGNIESPEDIGVEIYTSASKYVIKNYARIFSLEGCKKALLDNGPCLIAFPVYHYGTNMWKKQEEAQEMSGGHAMTLVGFDEEGFIIRNSWGDSWGDNGYCTYPYTDWGSHWEIWSTIDAESFVTPILFGAWVNLLEEPEIKRKKFKFVITERSTLQASVAYNKYSKMDNECLQFLDQNFNKITTPIQINTNAVKSDEKGVLMDISDTYNSESEETHDFELILEPGTYYLNVTTDLNDIPSEKTELGIYLTSTSVSDTEVIDDDSPVIVEEDSIVCNLEFSFTNTGSNMTFLFSDLSADYILENFGTGIMGAFYSLNEELYCAASIVITEETGGSQFSMGVMGNDTLTSEKNGFLFGEIIQWYYQSDTGPMYHISIISNHPNNSYMTNDLSYVKSIYSELVYCSEHDEPVEPIVPEPVVPEPVEPIVPEPVVPEPIVPEPVEPEPVVPEPVVPEPVVPEPVEPEPVVPEPVEPEPIVPEPVEPEPVEPEPVEPEPVEPEPVEPEPVVPEPIVPEPVEPEPIVPEPIVPEPVEPEPVEPEPVEPEPVEPEPVEPEPIVPEPVEPEPVVPEPIVPEPVEPEPVDPEPIVPEPVVPEPIEPVEPEPEVEPEQIQSCLKQLYKSLFG